MTTTRVWMLVCDGPGRGPGGCKNTFNIGFFTAGTTRYRARKAGWVCDGDKDYCAECARKVNNE